MASTLQAMPIGQALSLVETLMRAAFERARDPRSEAYKLGASELLKNRTMGVPYRCPFKAGTAEADAFWSGGDEGRAIWLAHVAGQADAAKVD